MRNCKIFLLGVTSQEVTPTVPPKPHRVGLGLPSSAFFLPGLAMLKSLGTIRQILCEYFMCPQMLGLWHWAEAGQNWARLDAGAKGRAVPWKSNQHEQGTRAKGCQSIWRGRKGRAARKHWLWTGGWPSKFGKGLWPGWKKEKGVKSGGLTCTNVKQVPIPKRT